MSMVAIVADNLHLLNHGLVLLRGLSDAIYANDQDPLFDSGVGRHVRHILDHYCLFLANCPNAVDYDNRARDHRLEVNRILAVETFERTIDQLKVFSENVAQSLDVRHNGRWSQSTIGRELQHLSNHTLHHYALIALILRLQKIEVAKDFGVAPSTLVYRRTQKLKNDHVKLQKSVVQGRNL